jgi:AbrB family looped-hinge helix DNA binding protein
MTTKNVGTKGQVVIPKLMREALGLKPGVEVTFELRDEEIVIKKPQVRVTMPTISQLLLPQNSRKK